MSLLCWKQMQDTFSSLCLCTWLYVGLKSNVLLEKGLLVVFGVCVYKLDLMCNFVVGLWIWRNSKDEIKLLHASVCDNVSEEGQHASGRHLVYRASVLVNKSAHWSKLLTIISSLYHYLDRWVFLESFLFMPCDGWQTFQLVTVIDWRHGDWSGLGS